LFEPGNWKELHSLLEKTILQEGARKSIGAAARKVAASHTWQANAEAILAAMSGNKGEQE